MIRFNAIFIRLFLLRGLPPPVCRIGLALPVPKQSVPNYPQFYPQIARRSRKKHTGPTKYGGSVADISGISPMLPDLADYQLSLNHRKARFRDRAG
jgi:hypothetical protein